MKKVLILTHEYYPYKGGVARYCYNLFKYYDKDRYLIITDHPNVRSGDNVVNMSLTSRWLKPSWLLAFIKLQRIVQEANINLIFTPNILPLGTIAYFLNKWLHIPYIISLHGLDIRLATKNRRKLTRKILQNAQSIIVNSKDTASVLDLLGVDKKKIHLFYPSIDFDTIFSTEKLQKMRERYNIKPEHKVLLTVGRLNKRKGQDLVIKALRDLRGSLDVRYFIVGRGDYKHELQNLLKVYNLENRVTILDGVSDSDLIYFYKMADLFVLPNRHTDTDVEGFGIVFLEAAAAGLPIIAGNSGGVVEILTNEVNAILVDNENLTQLTAAISMLLNNPAKADKLAEHAAQRYRQFPNAQQQSNKFKRLLQ